jgi:putative zinc finger/helix-turn-helix YgiT family protein
VERKIGKRCGECGQKSMALAVVPYEVDINHDGTKYEVRIEHLSVPKCSKCGEIAIDDIAGKQIDDEFRRVANLLTPEQIYEGRIKVGYTNQQEFADCLGLSSATISRWENGFQIQQSAWDGILRAFFKSPEMRRTLAEQHGLTPKSPISNTTNTTINIVVWHASKKGYFQAVGAGGD